MPVYRIDPLTDRRWPEFLEHQAVASVFHTAGWLAALRRTYGYEPFVLTTAAPNRELDNGLPLCRITSWLTGERLVSVPFADHCQPLFSRAGDLHDVLQEICREQKETCRGYLELRPLAWQELDLDVHTSLRPGAQYRLHLLNLEPGLEELFHSFDKSSIQRGIRRGERLQLTYEEGTTMPLLKKFYALQVLTRRRHRLPPQPLDWFANLLDLLCGEAKIRVLSQGDRPVASILTFLYNGTMLYKYGCSDPRFNNLHGTTQLFWRAIEEAKEQGAKVFDLGRSDLDNPGLIRFKSKWGSHDFPLTYWRFPQAAARRAPLLARSRKAGRRLLSHLPDPLLILLGKTLYKHAG